ncbi:hypothetical protein EWB00_000777 [Schistosoma japonicum]|uniref:Uncharacterized protein n=1 Tax=Schistosoma japonicum TaxID=6182 RepID=A0A4Z2CKC1_SCHJA|nr:hypothetical protein EWB00_000777 [Schistosoma japonicum]
MAPPSCTPSLQAVAKPSSCRRPVETKTKYWLVLSMTSRQCFRCRNCLEAAPPPRPQSSTFLPSPDHRNPPQRQ